MASIDELKSLASTRLGFARGNYFLVELPNLSGGGFLGNLLGGLIPSIPGITGGGVPTTRELSTLCTTATLPGRQVLTSNRYIGLENQKMAYGYAVDDVALTFHLLNDYGVRNFFDKWYSTIIAENFDVGYKDDYAKTVKIHQLRKPIFGRTATFGPLSANISLGGGSVYTVELEKAFPSTISTIELGDANEGVVQATITLSYTNWRAVTPSLLSNIGGGINLGGVL